MLQWCGKNIHKTSVCLFVSFYDLWLGGGGRRGLQLAKLLFQIDRLKCYDSLLLPSLHWQVRAQSRKLQQHSSWQLIFQDQLLSCAKTRLRHGSYTDRDIALMKISIYLFVFLSWRWVGSISVSVCLMAVPHNVLSVLRAPSARKYPSCFHRHGSPALSTLTSPFMWPSS